MQDGRDLFLKTHPGAADDFFSSEAAGFAALEQAGLPVPKVLGCSRDYLLLSYVKSARKCRDYDQQLGHELAKLHQADTTAFTCGHRFGFLKDNYAGSTRQWNHPSDSWIDFFVCDTVKVPTVIVQNSPSRRGNFPIKSGAP